MIRCAIEGRYFAPLRGLRQRRRRVLQLAGAARDHLHAVAHQQRI